MVLFAFATSDMLYSYFIQTENSRGILSPAREDVADILEAKAIEIATKRGVDQSLYRSSSNIDRFRVERIEQLEDIASKFNGEMTDDIGKQWNRQFIQQLETGELPNYMKAVLSGYKDSCMTFDSYDGSIFPIYRYTANCSLPNSTLTFNDFGWTGSDVKLIKPQNTIRIGFVGGSTTQKVSGCDYSYSDYVGVFLNNWAVEQGLDIRFETINTGRVALRSMDFASIVKHELIPVAPDLVIYYEGRNQFSMQDLVGYNHYDSGHQSLLYRAFSKSIWLQLVGKKLLKNILHYFEAIKPDASVTLHNSVNEANPNIYNQNLPVSLPQIIEDLDSIRLSLKQINSQFIMCSFSMLANDSLFENYFENASIYTYWNHDYCGVRLSEIERLSKLENKVFRNYADVHDTYFVDVATDLLSAPEAFIDGIHLSCDGTKLHGWSVFTQLLPMIEEQIKLGQLPCAQQQYQPAHPFINSSWKMMPVPK